MEPITESKLNYEITDDLLARLAISRGFSRPSFSMLRAAPISEFDFDQVSVIKMGNPELKPKLTDQIDLSLEWYFDEGATLSTTLYYKDFVRRIKYVVEEDVQTDFGGPYKVNQAQNIDGNGWLAGVELAINIPLRFSRVHLMDSGLHLIITMSIVNVLRKERRYHAKSAAHRGV